MRVYVENAVSSHIALSISPSISGWCALPFSHTHAFAFYMCGIINVLLFCYYCWLLPSFRLVPFLLEGDFGLCVCDGCKVFFSSLVRRYFFFLCWATASAVAVAIAVAIVVVVVVFVIVAIVGWIELTRLSGAWYIGTTTTYKYLYSFVRWISYSALHRHCRPSSIQRIWNMYYKWRRRAK